MVNAISAPQDRNRTPNHSLLGRPRDHRRSVSPQSPPGGGETRPRPGLSGSEPRLLAPGRTVAPKLGAAKIQASTGESASASDPSSRRPAQRWCHVAPVWDSNKGGLGTPWTFINRLHDGCVRVGSSRHAGGCLPQDWTAPSGEPQQLTRARCLASVRQGRPQPAWESSLGRRKQRRVQDKRTRGGARN